MEFHQTLPAPLKPAPNPPCDNETLAQMKPKKCPKSETQQKSERDPKKPVLEESSAPNPPRGARTLAFRSPSLRCSSGEISLADLNLEVSLADTAKASPKSGGSSHRLARGMCILSTSFSICGKRRPSSTGEQNRKSERDGTSRGHGIIGMGQLPDHLHDLQTCSPAHRNLDPTYKAVLGSNSS